MSGAARFGLVLVGLVAIASGVGMCSRVADRGRYATPYSSIGAGPDGTRGLFLAAEGLGASPVRWTRDLSRLPPGGTLLAFGGCALEVRRPVRRYESEALVAWVRSGGLLVVAGAIDYLPDGLGVRLERPPAQCGDGLLPELLALAEAQSDVGGEGEDAPVEEYPPDADVEYLEDEALDSAEDDGDELAFRWAAATSPLGSALGEVPMEAPARVVVDEGIAHEVLFTIGGEPAGVLVPHGRGAVVALGSATAFENEWVGPSLGGVLLFRLHDARSGGGPIVFDEYHLGVGATRSIVQYLRELGAGPLLAQLAFAIAMLLFRVSARFGRPVAEPPPDPGDSAPYVGAIASLYARSGDLAGVVELLRRRALARVARHHRVDAPDGAALAERAAARGGDSAAAAARDLATSDPDVPSRRAMVDRVRAIDALEVAATSGGRD